MKKRDIITGCVVVALAGAAVTGFTGWYFEHGKISDLEAQINTLQKQEKRSKIDRSVSRQMEEIANEQREISDEQREEALQQTRVANEMRHRSEIERINAIEAERKRRHWRPRTLRKTNVRLPSTSGFRRRCRREWLIR